MESDAYSIALLCMVLGYSKWSKGPTPVYDHDSGVMYLVTSQHGKGVRAINE